MMIRQAIEDDVDKIIEAVVPYAAEIGQVWSWEDNQVLTARAKVLESIREGIVLISLDGSSVSGVLIACYGVMFFADTDISVELFYIPKKYRGTSASRDLINGLISLAKAKKRCNIYAVSLGLVRGSGSNDALFRNTFSRCGFEVGNSMMKLHMR